MIINDICNVSKDFTNVLVKKNYIFTVPKFYLTNSGEKFRLFSTRVIIHLLVFAIQGGFFFGLFKLYNFVPEELNRLKCPSSG